MTGLAKVFFAVSIIFFVLGLLMLAGDRIPWLGRLPGDIVIKRGDMTIMIPVMTCLLLSLLLNLFFYLAQRH